jgi:hypothetical protein
MDLPPRIVTIPLDRTFPEDGLDCRGKRLARYVSRGEQLVGWLLAHDQPNAIETVEELVEPQRTSPGRFDELAGRGRCKERCRFFMLRFESVSQRPPRLIWKGLRTPLDAVPVAEPRDPFVDCRRGRGAEMIWLR